LGRVRAGASAAARAVGAWAPVVQRPAEGCEPETHFVKMLTNKRDMLRDSELPESDDGPLRSIISCSMGA
jgi:hypothetical protein